jgi:hypothetical protein
MGKLGQDEMGMAFSKSEDSQRECREFANPCTARKGRCGANKSRKICEIRPFALHPHCTTPALPSRTVVLAARTVAGGARERSAVQVFAFQNC